MNKDEFTQEFTKRCFELVNKKIDHYNAFLRDYSEPDKRALDSFYFHELARLEITIEYLQQEIKKLKAT